jgi:hypothetical protein
MAQIRTHAPHQTLELFDHLVGAGDEIIGERKAQSLRGLQIYDELILCGSLDREVRWFRSSLIQIRPQPAKGSELPVCVQLRLTAPQPFGNSRP